MRGSTSAACVHWLSHLHGHARRQILKDASWSFVKANRCPLGWEERAQVRVCDEHVLHHFGASAACSPRWVSTSRHSTSGLSSVRAQHGAQALRVRTASEGLQQPAHRRTLHGGHPCLEVGLLVWSPERLLERGLTHLYGSPALSWSALQECPVQVQQLWWPVTICC